jgi:uncharacterized phage protein gp47/JayE
MSELTSAGLSIDDLETVRAEVVADLRSKISPVLDVSPDSATGQKTDIYLERLQSVAELLQLLFSSLSPMTATGLLLEAVCSITGTYKNPATKGSVTLKLSLDAGKTVPAGSQAAVSGDPDNIWVIDEDVTSVAAGDYTETATALLPGAYPAPAGTITEIVTAVAGWTAVTNDADANKGDEADTDSELRTRREQEIALGGSTNVGAIKAEVSELDWIDGVVVYENTTDHAIAPMPAKSVEVVIKKTTALTSAQVAELAELIFEEKAGGVQAFGSDIGDGSGDTYTIHEDAQGNSHAIGWTLATGVTIHVAIDISSSGDYDPESYEGDTALKAAIASWGNTLSIGEKVAYFQLIEAVMSQPGIDNATTITVDTVDPPVGTSDIAIGQRQRALFDSSNIDVTS